MTVVEEVLDDDFALPDDEDEAAHLYHVLIKQIHPDVNKDPRATDAVVKLNLLFGRVGTLHKTLTTRRNTYSIVDGCITTCGTINRWRTVDNYVDIASEPKYNDLIEHEYEVMKTFVNSSEPIWYPDVIENFALKQGGVTRRGNVWRLPDGLRQLSTYPKLPAEHVVWIWRRLLKVLHLNQELGLVHGAIFPWSIWIHPSDRAVILSDWRFSTYTSHPQTMTIVPKGTKNRYPPYIVSKTETPSPGLDIFLAAKAMLEVARSNEPFLTRFLRGCSLSYYQPQDPLQLRNEFDRLLERRGKPFFPRRYSPLTMKGI